MTTNLRQRTPRKVRWGGPLTVEQRCALLDGFSPFGETDEEIWTDADH